MLQPTLPEQLAFCPVVYVASPPTSPAANFRRLPTLVSSIRVRPCSAAISLRAQIDDNMLPHSVVRKTGMSSAKTQGTARLPDLRNLQNVNELLDVVSAFVVQGKWTLSAEEAAISLHFLHRATHGRQTPSASSTFVVRKRHAQSEVVFDRSRQAQAASSRSKGAKMDEAIILALSSAIAQAIRLSALEPKYLSMSLTALSDRVRQQELYQDVFRLASKSIQDMARKSSFANLRSRSDRGVGGGGGGGGAAAAAAGRLPAASLLVLSACLYMPLNRH